MTAALAGVDLSVRYGGIRAVDRVSVHVDASEIVGVVGANGAGKTSLLDCLGGQVRPDEGRVVFEGGDVTRVAADGRARLGIIRLFQDAWLFPTMAVRDILLLAHERRIPSRLSGAVLTLPGWRDDERRRFRQAASLASSVGLEPHLDLTVDELSTGLRRVLAMACALALGPRVLLLDEPTAGLASSEVPALGALIRRARDETGVGVVMAEHDLPLVWRLADRVVVLSDGSIVGEGPPAALGDHPAVSFGE
jgi:ABC-type branched-subunit amino acid transport system ATPase component